jgi:hypothetical protein
MSISTLLSVRRPEAPNDYPSALTQFQHLSDERGFGPLESERRTTVWKSLKHQLERQTLVPLILAAQETANPVEGNLFLAVAEISRIFHLKSLLVAERMSRTAVRPGADSESLPAEDLKQLLAMADRIATLSRELELCSAMRPEIVDGPLLVQSRPPRVLPSSD